MGLRLNQLNPSVLAPTTSRIEMNERPNVIINGNMDFFQRGLSFAAAANNQYSADRFRYAKNGSMVHTLSRHTDVPTISQSGFGSTYALLADCTTAQGSIGAGDYCLIQYMVEGYDFAAIHGQRVALSFWVKSAKTGIYSVSLFNGANTRSMVKEYTITAAETWEKKTIIFDLNEFTGVWNYDNTIGMTINWVIASGSTYQTSSLGTWLNGVYQSSSNQVNGVDNVANDFHLAQVQMVVIPSVVSSWNASFRRAGMDIGDELRKAQRYFEKSYELDIAPGTIVGSWGPGVVIYRSQVGAGPLNASHTFYKVSKRPGGAGAPHVYNSQTGTIDQVYNYAGAGIAINGYTGISASGFGFEINNPSGPYLEWCWASSAEL